MHPLDKGGLATPCHWSIIETQLSKFPKELCLKIVFFNQTKLLICDSIPSYHWIVKSISLTILFTDHLSSDISSLIITYRL